MTEAQHWYNNIPLVLVLALIGLFTAFGVYKATVGYLTERSNKMDVAFASLQDDIKIINESVTKIFTVMTGITGNNGMVGDMKDLRRRTELLEKKIAILRHDAQEAED